MQREELDSTGKSRRGINKVIFRMKTRKRATTTGEVEKNNDKTFYVQTRA